MPKLAPLELDVDHDRDARDCLAEYARRIDHKDPDRARRIRRLVGRLSTAEEIRQRAEAAEIATDAARELAMRGQRAADLRALGLTE